MHVESKELNDSASRRNEITVATAIFIVWPYNAANNGSLVVVIFVQ
jgi:hypothetical protein